MGDKIMEKINVISESKDLNIVERMLLLIFLYPLYFLFRYGLDITSLTPPREIRRRIYKNG